MNPDAEHADYDYAKAPELHLYQMTEGTHTQRVVDHLGKVLGEIKVTVADGKITLDVSALAALPRFTFTKMTKLRNLHLRTLKAPLTKIL